MERRSFDIIQSYFKEAKFLHHRDAKRTLYVDVDSCKYGIGAMVLSRRCHGSVHGLQLGWPRSAAPAAKAMLQIQPKTVSVENQTGNPMKQFFLRFGDSRPV